jgi:hypothetical protein
LDAKTISAKVLPVIVTLSADPDAAVREETINALGTLVLNLSNPKDMDKVAIQFNQYFSDSNRDYAHQMLKLLAKIIPKVDAGFREKYILRKLFEVGKENNMNPNNNDRKQTAVELFDCYRALNGCCK